MKSLPLRVLEHHLLIPGPCGGWDQGTGIFLVDFRLGFQEPRALLKLGIAEREEVCRLLQEAINGLAVKPHSSNVI